MTLNTEDIADLTRTDVLERLEQVTIPVTVVIRGKNDSVRIRCSNEGVTLFCRNRLRLFYDYMLSSVETLQRNCCVGIVRCDDSDQICIAILQQSIHCAVGGDTWELLFSGLQARRIGVGREDLRVGEERRELSGLRAAARAEVDDPARRVRQVSIIRR